MNLGGGAGAAPAAELQLSLETQAELLLRLFVALVLGAVIGLERRWRGHPAGFRTMAMVSVGSSLFAMLGELVVGGSSDPTRIAAQIVTGIGFLGAGTIIRHSDGVRGLTTAAAIWVVAAIGMAAGFGAFLLAVGTTALVLFMLVTMRIAEVRILALKPAHPRRRPDEQEEPD